MIHAVFSEIEIKV